MKNIEEFSGKQSRENGPAGRTKDKTAGAMGADRETRGDSKVESNDSPEVLDRGRYNTSLASLQGVGITIYP